MIFNSKIPKHKNNQTIDKITQRYYKPDKFYTKPDVAELCVSTFTKHVNIKKQDVIVEPSAGNGSFLKPLRKLNCDKVFIDIDPECEQITQADFLTWKPDNNKGHIHVIGNPPFGKQSTICLKFIKHASSFAESFGFILPATFKRCTMKNRIPLNFKLLFEKKLPSNSFYGTKAQCIFQIWKKTSEIRKIKKFIREHEDFEFLKTGDMTADFCIRNTGSASSIGKICTTRTAIKAPRSFHWIKANINDQLLMERFRETQFSTQLANVRISHLPKYELVSVYKKKT